ncbi:MAG TPA: D-aminoacyl-tRNA deacylase [Candidatus Dojkabacteria bacterium]|jgi:D-tyrosyl-tRNA(Tyr) deacylase
MKLLVQRVNSAKVIISNKHFSQIGQGLCVFLGIKDTDTKKDADFLIGKLLKSTFFESQTSKKYFDYNVQKLDLEILIVSQFTLYGNLKKGTKPSFSEAMNPEGAKNLYNYFVTTIKKQYSRIQTGQFGARMKIELENDGPVTFIIESK